MPPDSALAHLALAAATPPDFRHFADPVAQWAAMPSFVLGELLFLVGAAICLWHAVGTGRSNVLIWCAALVAGTANDLIFMALPLVDNFWQAQGTVMLTPRMPLYIPCVYVCFMYVPTAAVRRLGLTRMPTATLSGLGAMLFYAPYDIVGARFLWWTWHDTDAPIAERILGAPASSSLWVLTFVGAFALLVDFTLRGRVPNPMSSGPTSESRAEIGAGVFAAGFARVAGLTTALMMVQMTVLQQSDGGTPGRLALAVGVAIYASFALPGLRRAAPTPPTTRDRALAAFVAVHLTTLTLIGAAFDPAEHRSTGLHQPIGECYVEQTDITGQTRFEFLCVEDFDEDFDFHCAAPPARGPDDDPLGWYTICGRERPRLPWLAGLAAIAVVAALSVAAMLLVPVRAEGRRAAP